MYKHAKTECINGFLQQKSECIVTNANKTSTVSISSKHAHESHSDVKIEQQVV